MKNLCKKENLGSEIGLNLLLDVDISTYVQSQLLCGVVCRLSLLTALQDKASETCVTVSKHSRNPLLVEESCSTRTCRHPNGDWPIIGESLGLDEENANQPRSNGGFYFFDNDIDNVKSEKQRVRINRSQVVSTETQNQEVCDGKNPQINQDGVMLVAENQKLEKRQNVDTFNESLGNWCDMEDTLSVVDNKGIDMYDDTREHEQDWTENWDDELNESVPGYYNINLNFNASGSAFNVDSEAVVSSSSDKIQEDIVTESTTPGRTDRDYDLITCNPRKLYISNVAFRTSQRRLWTFWQENFGPVEYCQLLKDKWNHSKGRGFVTFKHMESVEKAKEAGEDQLLLDRRVLRVEQATWKKYKPSWEEMREQQRKQVTDITPGLNLSESSTTTDDYETRQNIKEGCDTENSNKENNNIDCSTESTEGSVNMSLLNDYILLHILSYLPLAQRVQCERVCKKWRAVCSNHWKSLKHLSFTGQVPRYTVFTDKVLRRVLKFGCPTLESLDLSSVTRTLSHSAVTVIGKNCPNLKKINLSGMTFNQKSLRSLSEMCRNIEWISLRNCHEVGEKGMWSLFVNCKQLRYLDLADNRRINGKCFHVSGHHVTTLDLSDCVQLSDEGLRKLADRWTVLQELHLSGCLNITDAGFRQICESLASSIRVLSVCGTIAGVSSVGLRSLSALKQLEELDLNRNNSVDDSVVNAVAYKCTRLRRLDLTLCGEGVTDASLTALAYSPLLEDLALSYLINVEESGLTQISANGMLQRLVARGCSAIPEEAFVSVVTLCPRLSHLDVCGCGQVTLELVSACLGVLLSSKEGQLDLHTDHCLDLHIGGTSVSRDDLPPIPEDLLSLHHHNLCIDYLRPDRELFFGDMLYDDDDDFSDDFQDFMDPCDFEGDFLDHDDPLYEERFMMS